MITLDDISSKQERFYETVPKLLFPNNRLPIRTVSQVKFLSELDPRGHLILNPDWYHDIVKEVPLNEQQPQVVQTDGNTAKTQFVTKKVERVSIAMQQVILSKQLTHICGNKTNFDIMELNPTQAQTDEFVKYKQKWILYNGDSGIYEFCKSVKATGDGAFCLYRDDNNHTSYRVFSILNNDLLHPIFDYTGKLKVFGRTYVMDDMNLNTESDQFLEVWDDNYYYLFASDIEIQDKALKVPEWNERSKYSVSEMSENTTSWYPVLKQKHGFSSIPIVYCKHKEGACWTPIQPLIDSLEKALSELFENNKSYAFRIMYIQGGFEIQGDLRDNVKEPRAILLSDADSKVGTVDGADASASFKEQLNQTLDFIKMAGFIVTPPESGLSGGTSGTAIKILYAPAIEKAKNDIHFFTPYITAITNMFKDSISKEDDMSVSTLNTVHIRGYLTPYIPQNDQELVNNLAVAKGAGYLSAETCQEKDPNCTPQEQMRVKDEADANATTERNAIVGASQQAPVKNGNKEGMNASNMQKQLLSDNGD